MIVLRILIIAVVLMLLGRAIRRAFGMGSPRGYGRREPGPGPNGSQPPYDGYSRQRNGYHRPAAKSPYEVLEVLPTASAEEIRSAYRRKAQQYHPDKVAGQGSQVRQEAERRMKEINAAYDELKRRNAV